MNNAQQQGANKKRRNLILFFTFILWLAESNIISFLFNIAFLLLFFIFAFFVSATITKQNNQAIQKKRIFGSKIY